MEASGAASPGLYLLRRTWRWAPAPLVKLNLRYQPPARRWRCRWSLPACSTGASSDPVAEQHRRRGALGIPSSGRTALLRSSLDF